MLREGSRRQQGFGSKCMFLRQVTCCFCPGAQRTVLTVYLSSPLDSKVDPFPIFFQALVGRTLGPSSILYLIPLDILFSLSCSYLKTASAATEMLDVQSDVGRKSSIPSTDRNRAPTDASARQELRDTALNETDSVPDSPEPSGWWGKQK